MLRKHANWFFLLLTIAQMSCKTKPPVASSSGKPSVSTGKIDGNVAGYVPSKIPAPVRNDTAAKYDEIVTLRYSKIKKGTFPLWLKVSQEGVWPYFEKIGARIVGAWQVTDESDATGTAKSAPHDYDEIYLMTRYANLDHWKATRDPVKLGGNGPDYQKCDSALRIRESITIESTVKFLKGSMAPNGPYFLPGLAESYQLKQP